MISKGLLSLFDAYRAGTFFALTDLKFDGIAFLQDVTFRLGMMNEQIRAVLVLHNESVTLLIIEPLNFTCSHLVAFCCLFFLCGNFESTFGVPD